MRRLTSNLSSIRIEDISHGKWLFFMPNSLPATERLKSLKLIQKLFNRNNPSVSAYPLRAVIYRESSSEEPQYPQILITVSKRNFKKAVDRNHIKRQIREAYRMSKIQFPGNVILAFIYLSKDLPQKGQIKHLMPILLNKIKSV
ncbi:ribonuclease P protein component [Leadbetterella byssophila]|nr:ribonuclease P protein component [Leadbetterella byssophila]